MKLIIMRHGEAERFRAPDEMRELSSHGRQQAIAAGRWLSGYLGLDTHIDLALVSTYERAQQTYQCLSSEVSVTNMQRSSDVIPEGDPKLVNDFVKALVDNSPSNYIMLIVSHMPFVSYILEEVTLDRRTVLFDTSSLVIVEYDIECGAGTIESIYHPDLSN